MTERFIRVEPCYSGGGIYVFIGELANGAYFEADDCNYDVRLLNGNVFEADWDTELWDVDWQESHLVADLTEAEALGFFEKMLKWVIKHEPEGNYQVSDMKASLAEIKSLKGTKGWR